MEEKSEENNWGRFSSPVQMSRPKGSDEKISLGEQAILSTKISERKRESEMQRARQEVRDASNQNRDDGISEHIVL